MSFNLFSFMNASLKKFVLTALLALGLTSGASAVTLLGYRVANGEPDNANPTQEAVFANFILDMALNTTSPAVHPAGTPYSIRNGNADPGSGNIGVGVQGATGANSISTGFEYAFGRYDGPNGGYILWYLGGAAFTAPATSDGDGNWGQAYGISHFTAFNGTSVPDGGTSLILLGLGLGAIALFRRKFIA